MRKTISKRDRQTLAVLQIKINGMRIRYENNDYALIGDKGHTASQMLSAASAALESILQDF